MNNTAFQIEKQTAGLVAEAANVIFDNELCSIGNISYNTVTGVITLEQQGRYLVNWWVATQASVSTAGAVFEIVSSNGDTFKGASPAKTGQVEGAGIINVRIAPVTLSLVNTSGSDFYYATQPPVKAGLVITPCSTDTNLVYVTVPELNSVAVIDGNDYSIIDTILVSPNGANPSGIAINPVTNRIYTANAASNNVTIIDANTNDIITDLAMSESPLAIAVNTANNLAYVTSILEDAFTMDIIDGITNTIMITSATIGASYGLDANPVTNKIYFANYPGIVSVFDGNIQNNVAFVPVGENPEAVGVNDKTNLIFVANSGDNSVSVIDGAIDELLTTITTGIGTNPKGVGVNTVTNAIYVSNQGSDTVSVIRGADQTVIDTITVGSSPRGIAVDPKTNTIYVANTGSNTVSVIDGETNTVIATVSLGGSPFGVAVNP